MIHSSLLQGGRVFLRWLEGLLLHGFSQRGLNEKSGKMSSNASILNIATLPCDGAACTYRIFHRRFRMNAELDADDSEFRRCCEVDRFLSGPKSYPILFMTAM